MDRALSGRPHWSDQEGSKRRVGEIPTGDPRPTLVPQEPTSRDQPVDRAVHGRAITRIAIVGCGFIGTVHSFAIRSLVIEAGLVDAVVVATCDAEVDKARRMLEPHGEGVATARYRRGIGRSRRGVGVYTYGDARRGGRAMRGEPSGHLLRETARPGSAGAERISRSGRRLGSREPGRSGARVRATLRICSGSVCRGSPSKAARAPIRSARQWRRYYETTSTSRSAGSTGRTGAPTCRCAGGGTLLEHSIHDVDLLSWMLGPVVSVDGENQEPRRATWDRGCRCP